MKIKTFQFLISNYVGNENFNTTLGGRDINGRSEYEDYKRPKYNYGTIYDSSSIDNEINNFIKDKKIIDIKIDTYTIKKNNNGYCDSVISKYTIIYE